MYKNSEIAKIVWLLQSRIFIVSRFSLEESITAKITVAMLNIVEMIVFHNMLD